jgi:NADH:ubiquinone reductase (non-electrogenic)
MRRELMAWDDVLLGIEAAAFTGQSQEEIDRLMHMVVVGGGPTGVEYAGELHDFLIVSEPILLGVLFLLVVRDLNHLSCYTLPQDDLRKWYPEIADRLKITLIEALPNVLPAFSKQLIQYTESTFKENKIDVLTRTMVKDVKEKSVIVYDGNKEIKEIPYGLIVWATGNTSREISRNLMNKLPETQTNKRGLLVDGYMRLLGAPDVYALGDCTATAYAPTAQVASQQGAYLARIFAQIANKEKWEKQLTELKTEGAPAEQIDGVVKTLNRVAKIITPFNYSHQGSLA